jgi:hypothetical protein
MRFFINTNPRAMSALPVMLLMVPMIVLALTACSPSLNWREVHNIDGRYSVLLPAKPASHERPVNLGDLKIMMQMTAAEADEMSFAVASATIESDAQRKAALTLMQQAMVKNISGNVTQQRTLKLKDGTEAIETQASGTTGRGREMSLFARFVIKDQRVYQAVALGPKDRLTAEIAETFLSSFALD